jgi:hypothetical protein
MDDERYQALDAHTGALHADLAALRRELEARTTSLGAACALADGLASQVGGAGWWQAVVRVLEHCHWAARVWPHTH